MIGTGPEAKGALPRLALRWATGLGTVLAVTFAAFLLVDLAPGDPAALAIDGEGATPLSREARDRFSSRWDLDDPLGSRYLSWLAGVVRGDLGTSWQSGRSVGAMIGERLGPTLQLNAAALALVLVVGVPLGWWCALRPRSISSKIATVGVVALYALPSFWVAMLLQQLLAIRLDLLPLYGAAPRGSDGGLGMHLAHLVLPASTLAIHGVAYFTRFARDAAGDGWRAPHALFARACGLGEARAFLQSGIRPSMVAMATVLGLSVPAFVSGSVLIESVFSWPGLGFLLVDSVARRDLPVVLGLTLLFAVLTVLGSALADAAARHVDPRIAAHAEGAVGGGGR